MNELLVAVGIVLVICMVTGYIRGLIKTVASLFATALTIIVVIIANPYVSGVIQKVLPIENIVRENCEDFWAKAEEEKLGRDEQIALIEESELPLWIKEVLLENNNSEVYEMLGVEKFSEYALGILTKTIADILSFLVTFAIVTIIVRTALYVFGIIGELPIIGGINRLAGGVLGLGTGLVIVWVLFAVITLMYDTSWAQWCMEKISDDKLLTVLYEGNILMGYITKF